METKFLQKILCWFCKIDNFFSTKNRPKLSDDKKELENREKNLHDFPIYVLRNYVEMIQKNGWIAYHVLKNIRDLESELLESAHGRQFLNMLQIESALVIDDFYEMLEKEWRREWQNIFNKDKSFITETNKIVDFFNSQTNKNILESNKYLIVEDTFLKSNEWIEPKSTFINYLWIKQFLFVDCDKNSHFPRDVEYKSKIDAILEKMKSIFPADKKVQAFFVITDGQHKPHVLNDKQNLLNNFNAEFDVNQQILNFSEEIKILQEKTNLSEEERNDLMRKKADKENLESEKKNHTTQTLIDFLNGIKCNIGIAVETTAEYYRKRSKKEVEDEFYKNAENHNYKGAKRDLFSNPTPNYELCKWTDAYHKKEINLPFSLNDSKWLYLIRITKRNEHTDKFDTLGMLGFYSTENLYNLSDCLLSKQLLMLLRRDISRFIINHHKNDEFAELIKQKEKADYTLTLNHGLDDYYMSKEINIQEVEKNPTYIKYLGYFFDYLINKTWLLSTLHLPKENIEEDNIEIISIVQRFKKEYPKIFYLKIADCKSITEEQCKSHIIFSAKDISITDLREVVSLPKDFYKEIVFELLYNIKKHVIERRFDNKIVAENQPLKITLKTEKRNGILYLSVENNHYYGNKDRESSVHHGLTLLEKVLFKHNELKKLEVNESAKTNNFKVFIPLKKIK